MPSYELSHDPFPVTDRHWVYQCGDTADLAAATAHAFNKAQQHMQLGDCDGFNLGVNMGEAAGQDREGICLHLILRQHGDCKNPFGGIRKVIDGQADYTLDSYRHPLGREISQELKKQWAKDQAQRIAMCYGPGEVPGYLTEQDVAVIESISQRLPDAGRLVEIGSFLGKSACEWARTFGTLGKRYEIFCIDSFNATRDALVQVLIRSDFQVPESPKDQWEFFLHYTKSHANITPIKAFFDRDFRWLQGPVDCVFEDSDHRADTLEHALPFWWKHLNNRGIICGHDYHMPQVKMSVDQFALSVGQPVTVHHDSMWEMTKHG